PRILSTKFDVVCMDPPHAALFDLVIGDGRAGEPPALLNRERLGVEWLALYQGHVTQVGRTAVVTTALETHFDLVETWRVGSEVLVMAGPRTWADEDGEEILRRVCQRLEGAAAPFGWSVGSTRAERSVRADLPR